MDDTAAIQDAIDAAEVQGGIVRLTHIYNIFPATNVDFGDSINWRVALHVNADNVYVAGPGKIVMRTLPSLGATKSIGILMFGNGGGSTPGESGTWVYNVGCLGVEFDFAEHSKAELLAMTALNGITLGFMYCQHFCCHDNILRNAYSRLGNGAISSHVSSKLGQIVGNTMVGVTNNGIWLDGARSLVVNGNVIIGEAYGFTEDLANSGIVMACNTDNNISIYDNVINGNVIVHPKGNAITVRGYNNAISNNRCSTGYSTYPLLQLIYEDRSADYPCEDNLIIGNLLQRITAGVAAGTAVKLTGIDVGAQTNPVKVTQNTLANNVINDKWSVGLDMEAQATQNWILNNVNQATTPIQFNATALANTYEGNKHAAISTFTADDATPSVMGAEIWQTANVNPTTITMLDDGFVGQRVTVLIQDANTTIDFTGTNLKGNGGADWNPANGDFMVCVFDGTDWYCQVVDAT